jgi:hypothetical protein
VPAARPYLGLSPGDRSRKLGQGLTQLSLVEHALCPLDAEASLRPNLVHTTEYFYTDRRRQRRKATVRVIAPDGLSAYDELYLWGLLALNFAQPEPAIEFHATPHYCLRQLGLIDPLLHRGGKTYELFRSAIERLSAVTYQNSGFYDPVRAEHAEVSFGFLSYRLPLDRDSSRAWRFYWNPLFFEICRASGSALAFDLDTYRELDVSGRRLYLLLKKMFWRCETTLPFDLRHLAVNVLGFSSVQPMWRLKARTQKCIERLIEHGILKLPDGGSVKSLFRKQATGRYAVVFQRGPHFDRSAKAAAKIVDSPYYELLELIGFDSPSIARILRSYSAKLVSEWADITLAAREQRGEAFFKVGPEAYFLDNIRQAAKGNRTPPDWWRDLRRAEERERRRSNTGDPEAAFDRYLEAEAREAFSLVTDRIFGELSHAGVNETEARNKARYIARQNLKHQFYREHPECRPAEPVDQATRHDSDDE